MVNWNDTKSINVRMNDFLTGLNFQDRIISSVPEQID